VYQKNFKRLFDVTTSSLALIVLSPVMLIVALLVHLKLGSPIFFKQNRAGKNGATFTIYKFRSMKDAFDEKGQALPDEVRLTKFGQTLRSTSLDELPGLFNIIKGDMSVVGPRPLAIQYLPYYTAEEQTRHDVLPGLTGLAQASGRNELDWDAKLALDVEYVRSLTFWTDIKIILQTVLIVLKREGIGVRQVGGLEDFNVVRMLRLEKQREIDVELLESNAITHAYEELTKQEINQKL